MRKPIAVRVKPKLLAEARRCAIGEDRTLTNLVGTVLRRRIDEATPEGSERRPRTPRHIRTGQADAA